MASYKDKELSSIVMKVAPSIVSVSVFAGNLIQFISFIALPSMHSINKSYIDFFGVS